MAARRSRDWTLLIYKIPPQPTRLRLQIWRRLQKMGALYLQDAACLLPALPEHTENMQYVAAAIEEMGGTCFLFSAGSILPTNPEQIEAEFRQLADGRLDEIARRLDKLSDTLDNADLPILEQAEEDLKRERVAYLRARKLAYCGSTREAEVDARLDRLKQRLDDLYRSSK